MSLRVMLIDDDETELVLSRFVVERCGLPCGGVVPFADARDALAFLRQDGRVPVDVILLDIHMPGMDGFGFLDAYRPWHEAHAATAAPVVMLSASNDPADRERAFGYASVLGYFGKPLDSQRALTLTSLLVRRDRREACDVAPAATPESGDGELPRPC